MSTLLRILMMAGLILAGAGAAAAVSPEPDAVSWSGETMGSTYSITLAQAAGSEERLADIQAAVEERLQAIEREMSTYRPDSELSRFNQSTSTVPFQVSASLAGVVRFALDLNRQTRGAFDPTLRPLLDLWGFGPGRRFEATPTAEEIAAAQAWTGCRHLSVTDRDELRKDIPQLQIDLNAVGNGYGADEAANVLRSFGLSNALVEVAGEIVALGRNPHQEKWRVGLDVPSPEAIHGEDLQAILHLTDQAVATSGDYRKFVTDEQGRRLSHILDPLTGRPIDHPLASVTVVAPDGLTADGLATALFVLGPEQGQRCLDRFPECSALFILRQPDGHFIQVPIHGFEQWLSPPAENDLNPSENPL